MSEKKISDREYLYLSATLKAREANMLTRDKLERILDDPTLLKAPIVRNGKQATIGYQPDLWKTWQ